MVAIASGSQGTLLGHFSDRATTGVFQKDQWEDEIWRELDSNLIMAQFVMDVPQEKISGKTLHQPKVGRMATRAKVAGKPVTLQAYKEDEYTMVFKRHNESSFAMEDSALLFLDYDLRAEYNREIAYAIALDVDNWLLGYRVVWQKLGRTVTAKDASNVNTSLNRAAILAAKLIMDRDHVPQQDRAWVFAPSQLISLLTIPEFTSGDYIQGKPTMTGEIGSLYGCPVIINDNIVKNSVNGLTVITGVAGDGTRTTATVPTPGFAAWSGSAVVSPYYPNFNLNGDPNGAGQQTELVVDAGTQDTLPSGAYTGMLVRKGWLKHGWKMRPKTEMAREVTMTADVVVTSYLHDAKAYRPEEAVLIHSYETV